MPGTELRAVLTTLGLTQVSAASFLGVSSRLVRMWCASDVVDDVGKAKGHEIPQGYAMLLRLMVTRKISPATVHACAQKLLNNDMSP